MKLNILIVDDEEMLGNILGMNLRSPRGAGITGSVIVCASVEQAREKLQEMQELSVLFTDWEMPGGGGAEVIRMVREKFPHVFVIAMTGRPTNAPAIHEHNPDALLDKPFELAHAIEAIGKSVLRKTAAA